MLSQLAFLDFNTPELILILAIILLLFGGKKLPELSRSLGESMREIRNGMSSDAHEPKKDSAEQKQESKS